MFAARCGGVSHWGIDASITTAVLRRAEVPVLVLHDLARVDVAPAACAR